jgi:hypothetical protein
MGTSQGSAIESVLALRWINRAAVRNRQPVVTVTGKCLQRRGFCTEPGLALRAGALTLVVLSFQTPACRLQEALMTRTYFVAAMIGTALLMSGAGARADAYRPGEFLMLDLNRAALSPRPLGPPAQFEAVPIEAKADAPVAVPAPVAAAAKPRVVAAKPQINVRKKIARVRGNPLDANAADTRVQVWPCRSGGICGWKK